MPVLSNIKDPIFSPLEKKDVALPLFIFNITERIYKPELMEMIRNAPVPQIMILSMSDTASEIFTPDSIPSQMAHENRFLTYKSRRLPWAFGLNHKRIEATAGGLPYEERKDTILCDFRPSHHRGVRRALDLALIPALRKHFAIDYEIAENHNQRLCTYKGCLTYGGVFLENPTRNGFFPDDEASKKLSAHATFQENVVIAAGTVGAGGNRSAPGV